MSLTAAQLSTLKADLAANTNTVLVAGVPTAINTVPQNDDTAFAIAAWYNEIASPDWWVYRTNLAKRDIYTKPSPTATVWNWPLFSGLNSGEANAWSELFGAEGVADASLPNTRQLWADVFSGPSGTTQREHCDGHARRQASNSQKLFSTGTGSTASPAIMEYEQPLNYSDIKSAWNVP